MGLIGPTYVIGPANGGKTIAFNNITNASNTNVAPVNPQRTSLTFFNPGTQTIYISQTRQVTFTQTAVSASNEPSYTESVLTPTLSTLGGTMPLLPGAMMILTGECTKAYQALAAGGTANPLTVVDSNV